MPAQRLDAGVGLKVASVYHEAPVPNLRPLRGLRYNHARVGDVSGVLCPPYDVISPSEREALLSASPANAVRLELPSATPASAQPADIARAATTLESWLADGTLQRDETPSVYLYEQSFVTPAGARRVARGLFCRLELEPYGPASGVRPHERTLAGPREHRFALLQAVRTHLSPVMLLYDDASRGAGSRALFDALTARAPDAQADGPAGVGQRLWVEPESSLEAQTLLALAGARELYIADGHHRYETALRYRDTPDAPPDARYVLALLYDAHSGGLELAPWHRVISDVADPESMLRAAQQLFSRVEPIPSGAALLERMNAQASAGVLAVWTRSGGALLRVGPAAHAPLGGVGTNAVDRLDVSVLSSNLARMIGATESELTAAGRLTYTHDAGVAVAAVERGEADACFILSPTPVDQVIAVAAAGEFMPPKSTYFYPKAATGLVFDPLVP